MPRKTLAERLEEVRAKEARLKAELSELEAKIRQEKKNKRIKRLQDAGMLVEKIFNIKVDNDEQYEALKEALESVKDDIKIDISSPQQIEQAGQQTEYEQQTQI